MPTPPQLSPVLLALSLALAAYGCAKDEDKKKTTAAPATADTGCVDGAGEGGLLCDDEPANGGESGPETDDEKPAALGLADGCRVADGPKGTCFACTYPTHEVAWDGCSEGKVSKPAEQCRTTLDDDGVPAKLACTSDSGQRFGLDFTKPTTSQRLYNNLSLIVSLAKLALAPKLEKDTANGPMILGILDVLEKHKLAIFTYGDTAAGITEIGELARKHLAGRISDEKIAALQQQVKDTIDNLQARRRAGQLGNDDLLAMAAGWLGSVPKEALAGSDVASLIELLEGITSSKGDLAKVLGKVTGEP